MRRQVTVGLLLAFAALAGCQSYTIVQRNVFADEDGNLVTVDYGQSDSEHVNTFISPATGKEMEFKSRLVVEVELPDGDSIEAWQCMNFLPRGTMYKTDNEKWMVLAEGFSCAVFRQEPNNPTRYREVFRGVHCDSPEIEVEKDERWHKVDKVSDPKMRKDNERTR